MISNFTEKTLKVALAGPPNVGKSTLINAIIGQKIAITTHKPQTTRSTTLGILTIEDTQIVFADTPGIFEPRKNHKLEKFIVSNAKKSIAQVDIILLLVDAYIIQKIVEEQDKLMSRLSMYSEAMNVICAIQKPILLIANKIDTCDWQDLTNDQINMVYNVIVQKDCVEKKIIPISALKNQNLDLLINTIKPYAKNRDWEFDAEHYTSTTERNLAEEITREQLYLVMHAEIPYSVQIDTDYWIENDDESISIHQSIIVLKPTQKNMIIGANGSMIKTIGERARREICAALHTPVHLFLHVKVRSDWIEKL